MTHVIIKDGVIVRSSDAPFVDNDYGASEQVDYEVVWQNGGLYKAGEEPLSSTDMLMEQLRLARDIRLTATDKYVLIDYQITPEDLESIKTYRQALRDLPAQPGAPWDGGGDETPWPEMPSVR